MVDDKSFFQYKESRALTGYKSAWLIKLPENDGKYSLIGATESVPYVFGEKSTFEFDILQSSTVGQVEGKPTLESQDIEVLHHRDNAYRFEKLKGKVWDFMVINAEYVGYKFSGTVDYRPNNGEADINRATVTIVPMDAEPTPVFNARPLIIETLCFADSIPATVKKGDTINLAVKQTNATISLTSKKIPDDGGEETDATANVTYNDTKKTATINNSGLYALTVKADGYASWTTTVYVEEGTTSTL